MGKPDWDSHWPALVAATVLLVINAVLANSYRNSFDRLKAERAQSESDRDKETIASLEREISDTERALQLVLNSLVRELAITLKFTSPTDRVSIYFHSGSEFVMAARYSADPVFHAPGRGRYPDSVGLISKAWRSELASFKYEDESEWRVAQTEDFQFSDDEVEAFAMRSLSMVGVRLECNKERVGVLIIESTRPDGATQRIASQMQKNAAGVSVAELLQNHSARVPDLRI